MTSNPSSVKSVFFSRMVFTSRFILWIFKIRPLDIQSHWSHTEQWQVEKMSRGEIERSRALQRGFLVIANSLAALAAFCTVQLLFILPSLTQTSPALRWPPCWIKVCVGIWSITSESFLLPLVPDTLLISSAYIQVNSLDLQILVSDPTYYVEHVHCWIGSRKMRIYQ